MLITNRLEKHTIECALKVQLKRLTQDKATTAKKMPIHFMLALNDEIARIKALILALKEES